MRSKGLGIALALAAGTLALASCTSVTYSSSAASGPPASASGPSCAWPSKLSVQTFNEAIPDPEAGYWDQPIMAGASTRITLSGTYPDARYFTLSIYTPYGATFTTDGVRSWLTDYQIAPEPGSVNPWQHRASPGGRYEVTIRPAVAPGQANVLPFPAGTSAAHPGYLIYRVYLPAGGNFSRATLPTITLTQGQASRTLPACRTHGPIPYPEKAPGGTASASASAPASASASARTVPPPGAFYGLAAASYRAGIADVNTSYVEAYLIRPPAADVVVVTAKAPTFSPGHAPSPWPAAGVDMRYWSMCIAVGTSNLPTVANTLPDGQTDYGCREDDQTRLADGDYAYVIGSEAQRAAISRVPGATFLPFSTAQTARLYVLLLRNKLVNPNFMHSPQNITQATDPAAASAAMGPYYPKVSTCALSTLTAKGLSACEAR